MRALATLLPWIPLALAATAEQWRGQSIYQVMVDRFAHPSRTNATCDPGAHKICGGTWVSLRENLDYIQGMGFTAIWISPVNKNIEGPTAYGETYHGYWVTDISQLNERFGTADDLKALSDELHKREMLLMVDVVVNNVVSTTIEPDYSQYFFKEASQYHPYCPIAYGNRTSEEYCRMGDRNLTLVDVNTEDDFVVQQYNIWIAALVKTYDIDGLRIDGPHVRASFWPGFCAAAGVFCIGEVYTKAIEQSLEYTAVMDSVLNFPTYHSLVEAFQIPGPLNMSALASNFADSKAQFNSTLVLGNFLENQDVPRWANMSVDPQSLYNAMTYTFMWDGIPVVYNGQEQGFRGAADPWNREALWTSGYANTTAYQLIAKLNALRKFLATTRPEWLASQASILTLTQNNIAFIKGPTITILTNIGSPPQNTSVAVYTPFQPNLATTDVLSCTQFATGSDSTVSVSYSSGGRPVVLIPSVYLYGSGFCGHEAIATAATGGSPGTGTLLSWRTRVQLLVTAAGVTAWLGIVL
ncbi:glycoside hydrolase family 13 protein [Auricularia subglabra TFB-10046 SS5]|nr:glycoside hydrolase family 13 protein [Auricularia subglabra TFB-10046 SS5]